MAAWRKNLINVGIALTIGAAGAAACAFVGAEFFRHSESLVAHARQGNPPILSNDEQLNIHLAQYLWSPNFNVHFLIGGGLPYSLERRSVAATITRLGNYAQVDGIKWSSPGVYLVDPYMRYLEDRMYLLGVDLIGDQKTGWERIFDRMQRELGREYSEDRTAAMQAAADYIHKNGSRFAIMEAHSILETYIAQGPTPNELRFEVTSDPSELELESLGERAAMPGQSGLQGTYRRFVLTPLNSREKIGYVMANVTRVFSDITLKRHWMREALLDDQSRLTPELRARYFGPQGSLRLVPYALTLETGKDVIFRLENDVDINALDHARASDACCTLRSDELSVPLSPGALREIGNRLYRGRSFPGTPIIRAVISRRRVE